MNRPTLEVADIIRAAGNIIGNGADPFGMAAS